MKQKMLTEICVEMKTMSSIFDQIAVKSDHFDFVLDPFKLEILPLAIIKEAREWCRELFTVEYAKILSIKKLLSDELWKRYELWGGFEEHRECVMLREALDQFRKKIVDKNRPIYFKKGGLYAALREANNSSTVASERGSKPEKKTRKRSAKSVTNDSGK